MTTIETSKDAIAQARMRMEKAVEDFRRELAGVRTGRANISLGIPARRSNEIRTHLTSRAAIAHQGRASPNKTANTYIIEIAL